MLLDKALQIGRNVVPLPVTAVTLGAIDASLNSPKIKSLRGGEWHPSSVAKLLSSVSALVLPKPGTFAERERSLLQRSANMSNPKTEPTDNTQKDPDQWVSGDDPMTGAQASYLKTLCEQAGEPQAYNDKLTKAEASKLIDEMRQKAKVA
jgi:hypothetical protein